MRFELAQWQGRRNAHRRTIDRGPMVREQRDLCVRSDDHVDGDGHDVIHSSNGRTPA